MFKIIHSVYAKPAQIAVARSYSQLADAFADMGDGIVIESATDRMVAFHERHLAFITAEMV